MKLLFNYLTHSVKESDSVIKSNKSNGVPNKANKGINKNGKIKPSTSSTELKLKKFFSSFKVNGKPSTDGESPKSDTKQCNSQLNGTPKKRSNTNSAKSSPGSKKVSPAKSPTNLKRVKANSLSTSASASAKKRAIERALKKRDASEAVSAKQSNPLEDKTLKKSKKLRQLVQAGGPAKDEGPKRKKSPIKSSKSKRSRKRADSECSDDSERSRPRRRASQTYFFKYQLARNPLKAEEEDLKQALLASLEQCGEQKSTSSKKQQQLLNDLLIQEQPETNGTNSKTTKHNQRENQFQKQPKKQNPKHPPSSKQAHSKTSSLSIAHNLNPVTPATVATSKPPSYDEEYLEKYRPDTEDFLTFICFRVTAPNLPSEQHKNTDQKLNENTANQRSKVTNDCATNNNLSSITGSLNIKIEPNINVGSCSRNAASSTNSSSLNDDQQNTNLRRSVSPYKINSNSASSIASNQLNSPSSNRRRPPTRQSPRLANTQQQKISDSSLDVGSGNAQQLQMNCNTAFNQIINYEEDLKKASIALEDMAQEITKSNCADTAIPSVTRQQNGKSLQNHNLLLSTADAIEKNSHHEHRSKITSPSNANSMPFRSNKHLVKGLMTREFAGTFADEEIIFESISNHKL